MMNLYCYWIYHPRGDPKIYFDMSGYKERSIFAPIQDKCCQFFLLPNAHPGGATNDIGNTYSINKFQTSIGAKSYKCSHLITPSSKDGGILSPPRGSDSIYPKNFKTRGNVIFTPGILVHKYHKTRGDQKSPPRGINFTTTLIKRFQNPGECDFHPGDSSSQILKTRGDQYLHPGDPITQITQSADFKTRGTWSPPGELISFYSKNCQILQPGGSNSSNS